MLDFVLLVCVWSLISAVLGVFQGHSTPPGCDKIAAQVCEDDMLQCQLYSGPSDDPKTMCKCSTAFYGACLRQAGCESSRQVGALTKHEIYMKVCVQTIMKYDCPDTTICAINCASDTYVDQNSSKIIPFNNYGEYYLRLKFCLQKVSTDKFNRYRFVDPGDCKALSDYQICTRWVPPLAFVPVALPKTTSFIEIDSCNFNETTGYSCPVNTNSARVYGNSVIWPRSYDVAQTAVSICRTNGKVF